MQSDTTPTSTPTTADDRLPMNAICPLLTEPDAAKVLNVSVSTIINYRKAGRIDFIRLGERNIRYEPAALERFIGSRRNVKAQVLP